MSAKVCRRMDAHGMRDAASYHHDPGSAVYHCCALQVCELCQDSEFWKSWSHWQRLVVFSFPSLSETLEIPSPFAATNVQLCKGRCCSPWLFSGVGPPLFRIFHVKVSNTVGMTRVISWEYASSFGIACRLKNPSKSECSILCGPIVTIFEMVRAFAIDSGLPPLDHFEALN